MTTMQRVQVFGCAWSVAERGSGPPVLFVHGFPLDHSMWSEQLDGLANQGRCIAPDLRGFGQSESVEGTVTMAQFADDLAELLDEMRIDQPVSFVGMSMGGYIGWEFILRHRHRLSRAVMVDTRAVADSPEVARGRELMADRVEKEGALPIVESMLPKLFAPATHQSRPGVIAETRQVMLQADPRGIAAALRGMAIRRAMTSELPRLDLPMLFLCGEHDAISPPDEMAEIAEQVPGARFEMIPQAGHMAPLENGPAINAHLKEFLSGD